MRKRTEQEILRLVLEYEVERMNGDGGDKTMSLYDIIVSYSLEGDEQPKHVCQYGNHWYYDYKDASITEEEFYEELYAPVENLVRERNGNRQTRLFRITDRLMEKRKQLRETDV
tara:strand:+ start:3080 stop:3421 length:342 start_codon:yes stop_codon:yes gene_type:complete